MTSEAKGPTAPQANAVCNAREAKHEAVVAVVVDLEVAVVSSRPLQVDEELVGSAPVGYNGNSAGWHDENNAGWQSTRTVPGGRRTVPGGRIRSGVGLDTHRTRYIHASTNVP